MADRPAAAYTTRATQPPEDPGRARARYDAYRRQQAIRLLSLLPEGAVRPLYRRAREWAGVEGRVDDPLAILLDFCGEILPLPPFRVWLDDIRAHPTAYLDDVPGATEATGPVTVEVRSFRVADREWHASLNVRPDGEVWRGHITFHTGEGGSSLHPTGEIFREDAAATVRTRFLDFDEHTLRAFLRSALP